MSEKILFQHQITEADFDAMAQPTPAGEPRVNQPSYNPTSPGLDPNGHNTATVQTDIAQTAPKIILAQNTISLSLPYMIGFVQPIQSSAGFAFGLQQKDKTQIPDTANPGDDIVVVRQFIETDTRQVTLDLTNETAEDIQNLFGSEFPLNYDKFIQSGGQLWDGPNGPLARFFLSMARQRMTSKINTDFVDWLKTQAQSKGAATIASWDDMEKIIGALAELREALRNQTGKSSRYWVVVSPKIAAFLGAFYGVQFNDSKMFRKGSTTPNNRENTWVTTLGDLEIFQYDFPTGEDNIYMGYYGGSGTSSVYYYPYSEYIIQGGEDYFTGQSNIYYRVRDTWSTNPLDTFNHTITDPKIVTPPANSSDWIVSAKITVTQNILA